MAKEKKRGFFSWLGFGKEEEKQPSTEAQASQTAQPEVQQPEQEAPAISQAEIHAEETVATTEKVVEQQHAADPDSEVKLTAITPSAENVPDPHDGVITPAELVSEPVDDEAPLSDDELAALALADADIVEVTPHEPEILQSEPVPVADKAPLSDDELAALALADADIVEVTPHEPEILQSESVPVADEAPLSDDELAALALADADIVEVTPHEPEILQSEPVPEADEAPLSDDELAALALADADAVQDVPENADRVEPTDTVSDLPLAAAPLVTQEQDRPTKEGFFARLKRSLVKTRQNLGSGFIGLFRGKKIDDELFEELEEQLLIADVGVETTRRIITSLTQHADRKQLRDAEALYGLLKTEMADILAKVEEPLNVEGKTPFVILMVGVNGVGKTTTIGKLARQYQAEGKSVMLAAGDTFRAAAVEQLQVWGQRNNISVVAQHTGADSASVIFDAIQAAKSRGVDVLIADTAGRLQNKSHLMEELKKITRVMKKLDEQAPHEVMLTIDASTGQNAISQAKLFHEAVGLTGITLTKLDGTAKGGVIFSVADQFGIPIRYIGVGEGIEDLRPFKAEDFIEALFARED
ncbi:signal recognition particle-docking protein FtsY [Pantoea ananatis]|uniref:signal recognition particle-docking protein FtsY n=1 Tax=Pantoea ananas TaxID=553 RepID=UPI000CEB3E8F|nr:signal recognition particle-docking protein FtsY [Pantoea ananatis]AVG74809.1 signal recognition particle-docking protein FtsY [Pantoea ananatis]MDN4129180.1 signal recognition particle-docking protein FtsY [Pantoea ananatis]MDN4153700.1 signal recognition particle-docking protein FtsY [Pantoea ananatis]PQK82717.1 signal recognition particle-docking protein FtsY [Pantoea ananatis]PWK06410.1 fused signal recognition particle receptor [Pantoea ananatis]